MEFTPEDLTRGELEIAGLLPFASNFSYLARVCLPDDREIDVVYKPEQGEAPLWDFPPGTLCLRETAAYLVSEAGGWGLVPPTVLRDGPLGPGAVQVFVEHDPRVTAFELLETRRGDLRRVALFDLVVNNADRKAGHVLRDVGGRIWSVDHGICFHTDEKLRTVLWDFAGEPILEEERVPVRRLIERLDADLPERLGPLLHPQEIDALKARASIVADIDAFPRPGPGRRFPWPPV